MWSTFLVQEEQYRYIKCSTQVAEWEYAQSTIFLHKIFNQGWNVFIIKGSHLLKNIINPFPIRTRPLNIYIYVPIIKINSILMWLEWLCFFKFFLSWNDLFFYISLEFIFINIDNTLGPSCYKILKATN